MPDTGPQVYSQRHPVLRRDNKGAAADTVPDPPVGETVYFVTAVTSPLGETRFGRKAQNGVLTGRDPTVLPACPVPASKQGSPKQPDKKS